MLAIYNGQDTLISISDTSAKFIALYDSTLCTSCQTSNLFIWEEFANKNNNNFQTYIIFSAAKNDLFSVKEDLKKMRYNFPVYIDSGYSFIKMNPNHLWNNIDYHFFLLDEKQKISIIGFPFLKKKKEEEYIKVIEKMRNNISI